MLNDFKNIRITPRKENFSEWYLDVIKAADLAEHGPAKGTMIMKPNGYALWENIKNTLDKEFKKKGVQNVYFPLFIPERLLEREKDHVEGFSPEVAVVTYAGGKRLNEALIVRPTSETIIYDTVSNWIDSHRDLPLLINQWANIVRWEMRPRLFLRTTEFLWQEGHTFHATYENADEHAREMLRVYEDFARDVLAIPVIPGEKSESEKFAGADHTYTVEAIVQDGKAIQFATSHNLGQNFSKVFNISYNKEDGSSEYVWQTSWGLSTRVIGALIMAHSDDNGLVLPPKVARTHFVVVPIWKGEEEKEKVVEEAIRVKEEIQSEGFGVELDLRDGLNPGEKYYFWEKRGIPVRVEIGPRDIKKEEVVLVRRDTGEKIPVKMAELSKHLNSSLEAMQQNLLERAKENLTNKRKEVETWEEFEEEIEKGNFCVAYWSGTQAEEEEIKEKTKATIRCIPFGESKRSGKSILTGKPSKKRVIFAKAY